jgi:hypothetical protein
MTAKGLIFYAIANGGSRHPAEASNLKRSGVIPGVPDLCIPIAKGSYHGLYIEMKRREGGVVSKPQTWWLQALNNNGYFAVMCEGCQEAMGVVENYMLLS